MPNIKINHTGNFLQIDKTFLLDNKLKGIAKVVLSIALCYKSEINVTPAMLRRHMAEGDHAIRSAIHELERLGYLHIQQTRNDGRYGNVMYHYYESPRANPHHHPASDAPAADDPDMDAPYPDHPDTVDRNDNNINRISDIDINNHQNNDINIYLSHNINHSIHHDITGDRINEMERQIKTQIDYDNICMQYPRRFVDDIVQTILSVMVQDSDYIQVNSHTSYPTVYMRQMFGRINPLHVGMIIDNMEQADSEIVSARRYLLTCLINAATNMETSYQYRDY